MSNLLSLLKKRRILKASSDQYWICPRCGTTNVRGASKCTECKNRRPW